MKTFGLGLFFLILTVVAVAEDGEVNHRYPLDVHVHYQSPSVSFPDGPKAVDEFLEQTLFEKAFLISQSYGVEGNLSTSADQAKVKKVDLETSAIVSRENSRYIGLCGMSAKWINASKIVSDCLKLPGMHGVKIHTEFTASPLNDKKYYDALESLFSAIDDEPRVILWHVLAPFTISEKIFLEKEIPLLKKIVSDHPNLIFVMAHSLYSAAGINKLADLKEPGQLTNLYFETSTLYGGNNDLRPEYVTAWRKFGMNRVLFGSDLGLEGGGVHEGFVDRIENSKLITATEKRQILKENGESVLKLLLGDR